AGIAHEINNPINFVYAGVNSLEKNFQLFARLAESHIYQTADHSSELPRGFSYEELKEDIAALIGDIRLGADRTAEIVKGLRNFSRIDEAERKLAHPHDGLDSTLVLLRNQIKQNIQISKDYDSSVPEINCFPGQLNQVFMNIITNAIQAYREQPGRIEIRTWHDAQQVYISIRDEAGGIPQPIQHRIFEPFFTTKDVGQGTGLGLSISYGIIEKHGGKLELHSQEGLGSEFVISLPK
ncbi:MAG: GHKL domain-containing protein, partial [Cytophagales bacterium]|nr:GHKL domain-containing protein [Cytophagales bacterium]